MKAPSAWRILGFDIYMNPFGYLYVCCDVLICADNHSGSSGFSHSSSIAGDEGDENIREG